MDVEINDNQTKDKVNDVIDVTYLGETIINGYPPKKIYKMPIEIDGKQIIAYISIELDHSYNKRTGGKPTIKVIGWYDLDDSICGDNFRRVNYDSYYSHSEGKEDYKPAKEEKQEQIHLLDVQTPIPEEYEPSEKDNPFMQRFKEINSKIANKIFQMKKTFIMTKRKEQLSEELKELEQRNPKMKLSNVLSGLNDEQKEKAVSLYNKMILCIIRGKYSYDSYCTFIKGLPDVAKGKGIFLSDDSESRIVKSTIPRMTSTFRTPSNKTIAGISPENYDARSEENLQRYRKRVIDINHGYAFLSFRQLGELGDNEKVRYYSNYTEPGQVEAIGKIGPFIVCTGDNDEFTILPENLKKDFEVNEHKKHHDEER